jgi:hypothetical protein
MATHCELTLQERVKRARARIGNDAAAGANGHVSAPGSPAGSTPVPVSLRVSFTSVRAIQASPGPSSEHWWQQQHDSASKLDGLLTELGLPSPHREALASRWGTHVAHTPTDSGQPEQSLSWASARGWSGDRRGARVSVISDTDVLDDSLLSALSNVSGDRSKSPHRGGGPPSPGSAQLAAAQGMQMLGGAAQAATGQERTLQRRLEALQARNERMVQQTEDLVQTVNMYQAENRQLQEELGQRDGWIEETIRRLNQPGTVVPIEAQREGLRRWLQKVVRDAEQRGKAAPTAMDVRKAQEIADEMKLREREVRSRLVLEAQKLQAALETASEAQSALQDSDHRAAVTKAEVSLLRQQLQQALTSHQQVADELTKSRVQLRSMEGQTEVLEERLDQALRSLRIKDEELHSLHTDYSKRLVQIQELRKDNAHLESHMQRASGSLKYVVDDLRGCSELKSAEMSTQRESNVSMSRAARRSLSPEARVHVNAHGQGAHGSPPHHVFLNDAKPEEEAQSVRRTKKVTALDRTWERDITPRRPDRKQKSQSVERISPAGSESRPSDLRVFKHDGGWNHGREYGLRGGHGLMQGSDDDSGSDWRAQGFEDEEQGCEVEETNTPAERREGASERKKSNSSPVQTSRNSSSKVKVLVVSKSSQTTTSECGREPQGREGKPNRSIEVQHSTAGGGSDAEQWLAMEELDMLRETPPASPVVLARAPMDVGGGNLQPSTVLAPVGQEGPWRSPGVLWDELSSSAPIDLHKLHAHGKELSGYSLRRALKALGKGNSTTLSAVDSEVQRQLLLGVSSQGINNCSIFDLPLHATVVRQGQNSQFMLVVLEGRIKVWRSQNAPSVQDAGLRASASQSDDAVRKRFETRGGDRDTVLTECVSEVTEGGVLLEVEAVLGVPCPYTAMVAKCSADGGTSGMRGKKDKSWDAHRSCQVLSVTRSALTSLMDLYPSLHLPERLSLARKAFPYPGRSLGWISDSFSSDAPQSRCQREDEATAAALGAEFLCVRSAAEGGEEVDAMCRSRLVASGFSDGYRTPPVEFRDRNFSPPSPGIVPAAAARHFPRV